jgi:hypothetical protein
LTNEIKIFSVPLFEKGGVREIFEINTPRSPVFKGGSEYLAFE